MKLNFALKINGGLLKSKPFIFTEDQLLYIHIPNE